LQNLSGYGSAAWLRVKLLWLKLSNLSIFDYECNRMILKEELRREEQLREALHPDLGRREDQRTARQSRTMPSRQGAGTVVERDRFGSDMWLCRYPHLSIQESYQTELVAQHQTSQEFRAWKRTNERIRGSAGAGPSNSCQNGRAGNSRGRASTFGTQWNFASNVEQRLEKFVKLMYIRSCYEKG
jgi:hypothetical protein